MRIIFHHLFLFFLGIFLSACSLYQTPKTPALETPEQFKVSIKGVNENLEDAWWKNFKDPQLDGLVDLGLKNNYNYQIAIKNIDISETYVSQNRSYLFPQVNAGLGLSRHKISESQFFGSVNNPSNVAPSANNSNALTSNSAPFNVASLSLSASYEIDVWNQIRNSINQAEATVAATKAESQVIKLILVSNIVNNYYQLMALRMNLDNLKKQLKDAKEITELTQVQFQSGLIDESLVNSAIIQEEGLVATNTVLEKQQQIVEYTIAYLLGEYPENFIIDTPKTLNSIPFTQLIPAGIPSTMLAQRPDIQSAYAQMMSYGYLEKQTIANFLPTFVVTGNYGYASNAFSSLLQHSSNFWSFGLSATQSLFDYAIRMSEHKRAQYQFEASILSYKDTVVNAFREVNAALVSYEEDNTALSAMKVQAKTAGEQLSLTDAQYQAGLINYQTYLSSDIALLQSKYQVTSQQLLLAQDIVQIYQTLGMGLTDTSASQRSPHTDH